MMRCKQAAYIGKIIDLPSLCFHMRHLHRYVAAARIDAIQDLPEVTQIEYQGGHVYRVRFDDGTVGDVDFSHYIGKGPVFDAFRDLDYFRGARIEAGTIVWPGGIDIAPESLHQQARQSPQAA